MRLKFFFIFLLIFYLFQLGCSSKISIDKLKHVSVSYSELPDTVKKVYEHYVNLELDTFKHEFKCIGCKEGYSMQYHSLKNVFDLIMNGFKYEFRIGDKIYNLKANTGTPFVYYKSFFYYPIELNLYKFNYKSIYYYKVQLTSNNEK